MKLNWATPFMDHSVFFKQNMDEWPSQGDSWLTHRVYNALINLDHSVNPKADLFSLWSTLLIVFACLNTLSLYKTYSLSNPLKKGDAWLKITKNFYAAFCIFLTNLKVWVFLDSYQINEISKSLIFSARWKICQMK